MLGKHGQRRVHTAVGLGWSHLGAEAKRQMEKGVKGWTVSREASYCLPEGGQLDHSHALSQSPGDCTSIYLAWQPNCPCHHRRQTPSLSSEGPSQQCMHYISGKGPRGRSTHSSSQGE